MSPAAVLAILTALIIPVALALLVGAVIYAGRGTSVRRVERTVSHKAPHVPRLPDHYKARRCFEEARTAWREVLENVIDAVMTVVFVIPILAGVLALFVLGAFLFVFSHLCIVARQWWEARNESQRADGLCTIVGSIGGYGLSVSLGLPFWTGFVFLGAVVLYFALESREVKKARK